MIIFVSDAFADEYQGGAELTSEAILKGTDLPVLRLKSSMITREHIMRLSRHYWIFGNFSQISYDLLWEITNNLKAYSIIEYDYKYCKLRLPNKHLLYNEVCTCEKTSDSKLISLFYHHAKTLWFMSEDQKKLIIDKFPFLDKETSKVLSSVFCEDTLNKFEDLFRNSKNRSEKWLIQDSQSWVKGTQNCISYAKENNIDFETFSGLTYDQMLSKFASSKGFLFMPNGPDTCPRTVIEAKLLGCQLSLNEHVQHKDEEWFSGTREDCLEYLRGRAELFWETNKEYIPYKIPSKNNLKEETHFKIIVPSYNCEDWIAKTVDSIVKQRYENYECVIVDDISTDRTYELSKQLTKDLDKFTVVKNKEKKYALRNINDTIEELSPDDEDVIVLLDGDDWFSTPDSLSQLNQYYQQEGCYMTFGSFVRYPDAFIGPESSEYSEEVIKTNSFRDDEWRASHLKTYKAFLWDNIDKTDLKDSQGNFYESCYDQAIMLPMLEMSGENIKFIPEVLCVYNVGNPNAINKTKEEKQYRNKLEIRGKKRYQRLNK
tara:strand:+ start:2900 stop:4531 length:1632 start_codon:yes stop_codon:yes gene_type:complete